MNALEVLEGISEGFFVGIRGEIPSRISVGISDGISRAILVIVEKLWWNH